MKKLVRAKRGAKPASIELIARGLLIGPRGVLLCRNVGMSYTYLPGGHIEFGESAAEAAVREVAEELGMQATAGRFYGAIESSFMQAGQVHHELSLVFELNSNAIARRARLASAESRLQFIWQPVHALAEVNLLPRPLIELIPRWTRGRSAPFTSDMTAGL